MTRALDHCVLPVSDLSLASDRYGQLGFTVAPRGAHPFGTINACVYFGDDTFLEPLAVGDAGLTDEAIQVGNVFVARDALYRKNVGEDGFSALVFKTDDARGDHEAFVAAGISAGQVLDFSRAFVDPAGNDRTVSFRLAFAAHPQSAASYFFTCQRIDAPLASGRAALEQHANGVVGIKGVSLGADRPEEHEQFLAALTGASVDEKGSGLRANLSSGAVDIIASKGPLRLEAIRFAVMDLGATAGFFEANGIAFERTDRQLTVPKAPGQGATFIFEDRT
ncbi:VOC family protein [Aliihoeflea sp. PC F10.4]